MELYIRTGKNGSKGGDSNTSSPGNSPLSATTAWAENRLHSLFVYLRTVPCKYRGKRVYFIPNRILSVPPPGRTTEQPSRGHEHAYQKSMLEEGPPTILRAIRTIPAGGRKKRRNTPLIQPDQDHHRVREEIQQKIEPPEDQNTQ